MAIGVTYMAEIFSKSFISGVLASLVATLLVYVITALVKGYRFFKNAPFTGEWYDEICDEFGNVVKSDTYDLKQNKRDNTIKGNIHRTLPVDQNYRRCHCIGVVDGDFMILVFWPIRENNISRVNGCMYLKHCDDNVFKGYYLTEHNENMDLTPITLKKR